MEGAGLSRGCFALVVFIIGLTVIVRCQVHGTLTISETNGTNGTSNRKASLNGNTPSNRTEDLEGFANSSGNSTTPTSRSTTDTSGVTQEESNGVTLTRIPPYDNNDLYIGQVARLELVVNFTVEVEDAETNITLQSSSDETMLAFSRINTISAGRGLVFSNKDWKENAVKWHKFMHEEDIKVGVSFLTDIMFKPGRVNHNQGLDIKDDNHWMIRIEYELVCVAQGSLEVGDEMSTLVVVYTGTRKETRLLTFVFKGTQTLDVQPSFTADTVTQIEVLKPLTFGVSMFLPYPTSDIEVTVDASQIPTIQHGGLIVQKIQGRSVGAAFNYSVFPEYLTVVGYYTCPLKSALSLKAGPLVNRESQIDDPDYDSYHLTMDITLLLTDTMMASQELSATIGVNLNNVTLWVEDLNLTVKNTSSVDKNGIKPYLTMETLGPRHISSGSESFVVVALETPTFINLHYSLEFTTIPITQNGTGALKILSLTPVFYGGNVVCENRSTEIVKPFNTAIGNEMKYTFKVPVRNIGIDNEPEANILKFNVTLLMMGTAVEGEQYNLTIRLQNAPLTASVIFTVDAPPKVSFELHAEQTWILYGGYPAFAYIIINTPPGSQMMYDVTLKASLDMYNPSTPLSILTVNFEKFGSNVQEDIQPSNTSVKLSSSMNSSSHDVACMSFFVNNIGESGGKEANELKLEVVVMIPISTHRTWLTYALTADVNGLGSKTVSISEDVNVFGYKDRIGDIDVVSTCPTNAHHQGMSAAFKLRIVTHRSSTTGPVHVLIAVNMSYAFENASVVSKGRNVVCVNYGLIEATELVQNRRAYTALNIPLLCNRGRIDSRDEDELVIDIQVNTGDSAWSSTSIHHGKLTIAVQTASKQHILTLSHPYQIIPPKDLRTLKNVRQIHVLEGLLNGDVLDDFTLQWSMDGIERSESQLEQTGLPIPRQSYLTSQQILQPNTIAIGRFIRVIRNTDSCFIKFTETTTDDIPFLHGNANKTKPLLKSIIGVTHVYGTRINMPCMPLPLPGITDTPPYIWADFKLSLFNVFTLRPFIVYMYGHGIQCNSKTGPQVTMVVFPKHDPEFAGENHHRLCEQADLFNERTHCHYRCECREGAECSKFTLLMMQTQSEEQYTLCYLSVWSK